ncbi:MAG: GPP34 family phosphoprotein [Candidatus Heimdallarchaeota archaeon]|nr:GPP34 family phosphoprotein [Candidatus Heimdallarchaeota archaeon]
MKLNTRQKFIIIVLNNNKFKLPDTTNFKIGYATAHVIDLVLDSYLIFTSEKTLKINEDHEINEREATEIITDPAPKKLSYWINNLLDRSTELASRSIRQLIREGIIKEKVSSKFKIFKEVKYEISDESVINSIKEELNEIIASGNLNDLEMLALISLLYSCDYADWIFEDSMDALQEKMQELAARGCFCCNIIESIDDVRLRLNQYYLAYYHPGLWA